MIETNSKFLHGEYPYSVDFDTRTWQMYKDGKINAETYSTEMAVMDAWVNKNNGVVFDEKCKDQNIWLSIAYFQHKEDMLMFKLTFPEYVKNVQS